MRTQPSFLMTDDAKSVCEEAWYVNRIHGLGVTKTSTLASHGNKKRLVMDILEIPSSDCKSQTNTIAPARREFGSRACNQISSGTMKPWGELFADNDEDTDKMTLKEMQLSLRKASRRSPNKDRQCTGSGFSPNIESETPSVIMELLWEDSTSNSSDNACFGKGVSSMCDASQGQSCKQGAQISKAGDAIDLRSRQKRPSTDSLTVLEKEVVHDDDDDDWTLQKWQQLLKQGSRGKRLKKLCNLDKEVSKSMDDTCFIGRNSVALDTCIAHKITSDINGTHSESLEGTKGSYESAMNGCEPVELETSCSNQRPPLDGAVQGDSLHVAASSQPLSSARLELEDDSESVTPSGFLPERLDMTNDVSWSLKPCKKAESTPISKLVSARLDSKASNRSILQIPSREASILSGESSGVRPTLSWQRTQSLLAGSGIDIPGPKELRKITVVDDSEGVCKSKHVTSEAIRQIDVDQSCSSGSISIPTKLIEGATPKEQFVGTKLAEQVHSGLRTGCSDVSSSLDCNESLEIEEEQDPQRVPAKIPCKRKAISPMLQEFLLKASKLGNCGINAESKGLRGSIHLPETKRSGAPISFGQQCQRREVLQGSGFYRKPKGAVSEALKFNASSLTPSKKCEAAISNSQETLEPHSFSKVTSTLHAVPYPPAPPKGILRSSSQACQGPCNCEECVSVRCRAESASEFSQRQMQDIEGLAVKLMKDLSTLRNIVEERLLQSPSRHQGSQSHLSLDQLEKATRNALETEEKARKWLVRMARDCNRYCKIMRMQGRKLTFADESGGKLCHVKVFHSEPVLDASTVVNGRPSEVKGCTSSPEGVPSVEAA